MPFNLKFIKNKLCSDKLADRCLRSCLWIGLGSISAQAIRMVRMLALTYILAPEDIGLVILVWCALTLLQELSDVGTKHALIQNPRGSNKEYLDSAYIINLIRMGGLIIVLYSAAPFIANHIYQAAELQSLLRWSCLILVFEGITSMGLVELRKKLTLGRISVVMVAGHGAGTIIAIILAWKMRDALGVVIGEISGVGVICIISYLVHPYRPKFRWCGKAAKELIGYGFMAYMVSLIDAFGMRLDILILARIARFTDVGIYGPAMQIILAPCALFSLMTISVGFPALSMLQHDMASVRRGTAEIIKAAQAFTVPIFAVLALLGPDIVKVLPEKYADVGQALRWLSLAGFLIVFLRQMTPALYAIKQVYWFAIRGIMQIVIILIFMVPLYRRYGIAGICWTMNIVFIITDVFVWIVALRALRWPWRQWLSDVSVSCRALAGGLTALGLGYLLIRIFGFQWSDQLWCRAAITIAAIGGYGYIYIKHYEKTQKKPSTIYNRCEISLPEARGKRQRGQII